MGSECISESGKIGWISSSLITQIANSVTMRVASPQTMHKLRKRAFFRVRKETLWSIHIILNAEKCRIYIDELLAKQNFPRLSSTRSLWDCFYYFHHNRSEHSEHFYCFYGPIFPIKNANFPLIFFREQLYHSARPSLTHLHFVPRTLLIFITTFLIHLLLPIKSSHMQQSYPEKAKTRRSN